MMELNNQNNLPQENEPVAHTGRRFNLFGRFRRVIVRLLLVIYLLGVIAFGFWYWARPVRADQVRGAHRIWYGIVENFGVPVPEDERWGG